jgi:hypothetical protein
MKTALRNCLITLFVVCCLVFSPVMANEEREEKDITTILTEIVAPGNNEEREEKDITTILTEIVAPGNNK